MTVDVILSAHPLAWSCETNHGSETDTSLPNKKHYAAVLQRDDHTCQGCGFRSLRHMEVHHRNNDHANWKMSNLATLCPLCHQVFHPNGVTLSDGGYLAWLPEFSQAQLNRLLLACFVVQRAGNRHPFYVAADSFLRMMEQRRLYLENSLLDSSRAARYGQALLSLREDLIAITRREARAAEAHAGPNAPAVAVRGPTERMGDYREALEPIKLVANPKRFEREVDYWRDQAEQTRTPDMWREWAAALKPAPTPPAAATPSDNSSAAA